MICIVLALNLEQQRCTFPKRKQSEEFKQLPSHKKPSRKRNASEVSPPKVIRFLDQTASIGEDTYVYIAVDETTDTKFKHVLDKFALAKVEQFSLKYNYTVDGAVYLEKIRHYDADGHFVRFCTDNTWAHCLSEQDIDLEKWDFTNDQIIARWHDSSIYIAPRPRVQTTARIVEESNILSLKLERGEMVFISQSFVR